MGGDKVNGEQGTGLSDIADRLEKIAKRLLGECAFYDCKEQATFAGYCDLHRKMLQSLKVKGTALWQRRVVVRKRS